MSQWLANIVDAEFVVTDSFHGCVFSIIFGKPFVAVANSWKGTNRFTSLLTALGLVDRLVFNLEEYYQRRELLLKPIDYTKSIRYWIHKVHTVLIFLKMLLLKILC